MRIELDGIGIEVELGGDDAAPAVLLVHGWPDTHHMWRAQIEALVGAGYRVIAPDLRGFGESDRPASVGDAHLLHHISDLANLLDHLGVDRAHVVGHDWGAATAWALAAFLPDRVDHLVALSLGHPASFFDAGGIEQREKAWYMLAFQFEGLAEDWLSADDFANLRQWADHPEMDEVAARLADRDALTASLGIYRASASPEWLLGTGPSTVPDVAAPTMGVWSSGDMALLEPQMTGSADHVTGPWRYERIDDVGHWIAFEAPERLNELLLDFLPG